MSSVCLTQVSPDDSAAHIAEETAGAARAAPIAILVGVGATEILGWLYYIAASYATSSVPDILETKLALPLGQVFLNVLGKKGALALWCSIAGLQASAFMISGEVQLLTFHPVFLWMLTNCGCLARHLRLFSGRGSSWFAVLETHQPHDADTGECRVVCDYTLSYLWGIVIFHRSI